MKGITLALVSIFVLATSFKAPEPNYKLPGGDKKVALTSFWVSKHIGFEELGGGAGLAAAIASLAEDPNFNLQPVLDNFYNTFMTDYAEQFPFDFLYLSITESLRVKSLRAFSSREFKRNPLSLLPNTANCRYLFG